MERGSIKLEKNKENQLIIEVKLVNCTVWLTKNEIAVFFNVFTSSVDNHLRAIFKSSLLRKENVARNYQYEKNGSQCETTLYNLEVLIFISYRIVSYEAQVFREWVMKALTKYNQSKPISQTNSLITYNLSSQFPIVSLN